jgi:hypothetical protein
MKKTVLLFPLLAALPFAVAFAKGDAGKNLQHFDKEISADKLKAEMKIIKRSLGVECAACHQMKPERDMSVDTEKKKTARSMLDMQKKLNEKCFTPDYLETRKQIHATCFMCHKGSDKVETKPKNPDDEAKFNAMVDSGKKKKMVDVMKKLTDDLNANYFTWKDAPKATCWMCHRGRGGFRANLPRESEEDAAKDDEKPSDDKKADAPKSDDKKPDEKKSDDKKAKDDPF